MTRDENFLSLIFVELNQQIMSWNANQSRNEKINSQIVFCRVRKIRKESHLSNAAFQRDHLSSLVRHLNQQKAKKIIDCWNFIDKTINHEINYIFDEKTNFEIESRNHFYFFVSIQLINYRRFIFFNFLNNES